MNCNSRAKLFFGVVVDIDEDVDVDADIDFSDMDCEWEKRHLPQPKTEDYASPEWEKWRVDSTHWRQTSPLSVEYVLFGHEDSLRDGFCCSQFCFKAEWDEVTVIPNHLLVPSQEHIDGLKAFCDHFGIPWKEPQWHLVSLYF